MSEEDPIRNACLNPRSLVMTRCECFYCFAIPDTHVVEIEYNFGIKACDNHKEAAIRDCNAYQHRMKFISLRQATTHPKLKPFFDCLPSTFPVKRTSGLIEDDWTLNLGVFPITEYLGFDKIKDGWVIPVMKKSAGICKKILLSDFIQPEILAKLPVDFSTKLGDFIVILNHGVYAEDNAIYEKIMNDPNLADVPDIPEIHTVLLNGVPVRALMVPGGTGF